VRLLLVLYFRVSALFSLISKLAGEFHPAGVTKKNGGCFASNQSEEIKQEQLHRHHLYYQDRKKTY